MQIKENPIAMSEAKELKILTQTFVAKNLSNLVTFRRQQLHFLNNGFDHQKLWISRSDYTHLSMYRNSKKVTFPLLSVIGFTNVETITFSILNLTRLKTL